MIGQLSLLREQFGEIWVSAGHPAELRRRFAPAPAGSEVGFVPRISRIGTKTKRFRENPCNSWRKKTNQCKSVQFVAQKVGGIRGDEDTSRRGRAAQLHEDRADHARDGALP